MRALFECRSSWRLAFLLGLLWGSTCGLDAPHSALAESPETATVPRDGEREPQPVATDPAREPRGRDEEAGDEEDRQRIEAILDGGGAPRSAADLRAMERRTRQLVEKISPCTVGLRVQQSQGSGVIISGDGYVLTAAHVIQRPGLPVEVVLHDGRVVRGKTLGVHRPSDAGLVKIDQPPGAGRQWPSLDLGDSEDLRAGQWCLVLGHPGGYQAGRRPVVRFGRILSLEEDLIVTDCTLVGGDSGGPLLDMHGTVIGIHSRIGGALTANMHVPVAIYEDNWDGLVAGEFWKDVPAGSPFIGVRGDDNSTDARIASVTPGQPADRAGIRAGDVVLRFDGKPVQSFEDLIVLVAETEPGDRVKIVLQRDGEEITLDIVVGRRR